MSGQGLWSREGGSRPSLCAHVSLCSLNVNFSSPVCPTCLSEPQVASMCAGNVVNTNVPCCGMAGDRGMRYPELTAASLQVGAMVVGRKGGDG